MQKILYLRDDRDGQYVKEKKRREFAIFTDCVDASVQDLDECIKKTKKDSLQKPITVWTT